MIPIHRYHHANAGLGSAFAECNGDGADGTGHPRGMYYADKSKRDTEESGHPKTHRSQYLTIAEPLLNCGYLTADDRPGAGAAAQRVPGAAMATHTSRRTIGVRAGQTYQQ